jgi:hypothetical protein
MLRPVALRKRPEGRKNPRVTIEVYDHDLALVRRVKAAAAYGRRYPSGIWLLEAWRLGWSSGSATMPTSRRRPDAPPPPRTTDVADPLAPTAAEWREQEREKADRRRAWGLRFALVLSLPFLAGGVYALPLAYLWRVLCVRVPGARRWGVLLALPALAAAALAPGAVLGPTRDLLLLPVAVGPGLPADHVVPLPFPLEVGAPAEVGWPIRSRRCGGT